MLEIIKTTGVFFYPLGLLFILGGVFFFERLIFLHKGQVKPEGFLQGIKNLLTKGRLIEAVTLCQETPGSVANLIKVSLVAYQNDDMECIPEILRSQGLLELPVLRKRIESLRVMGQLSSLLGLIGSVFFLLKGFWNLSSLQAYTQLTSFSPYIVSALSISFLGLIQMFLFYGAYHFLMGRVRALVFDMEWAASEILLFFKQNKK